jgi:UDP-3-O-[3-hydroxymyristoyl] glucosamine N-acyltransferase
MKYKASQIALFLNGEILGDPNVYVDQFSKIEEGKPGSLSFLSNPKYTPYIYTTEASVVLVNRDFTPDKPVGTTLIKVDNSYDALGKLMQLVQQSAERKTGIESPSYISESAKIGKNVYIGAFAYISDNVVIGDDVSIFPQSWVGEGSSIGARSTLFSGVKIYPNTLIGERCTLHSGVVIGADGFGFVPQPDGTYQKLPQLGNVVLDDDVEIGANTTIDCATMGSTRIAKGTKIDNLVQIGHNCIVGENTVIAALTGIAGSSSVGNNVVIAGQVGIAGHLKIGNKVVLAAQTGVTNNVPDEAVHFGSPSFEIAKFRRSHIIFKDLPNLAKEIRSLRKELDKLKEITIA